MTSKIKKKLPVLSVRSSCKSSIFVTTLHYYVDSEREFKDECLLDATNWEQRRSAIAGHRRSFVLKGDRTEKSISGFKGYLTLNHGLNASGGSEKMYISSISSKNLR